MIKIIINYHSAVDVITNSSSEIFCQITSKDFLNQIKEELEKIFKREVWIDEYSDESEGENSISFWIEQGNDEIIIDDFNKMLKYILDDLVGEQNYKINTNVSL